MAGLIRDDSTKRNLVKKLQRAEFGRGRELTYQFFAEQVLDVVSKHDGAVRYDASSQQLSARDEPSTAKRS